MFEKYCENVRGLVGNVQVIRSTYISISEEDNNICPTALGSTVNGQLLSNVLNSEEDQGQEQ